MFGHVRALVFDNHEPWKRQLALARRALGIYRTLRTAGVVESRATRRRGATIRLTVDLQPNFALNQPLSPFALAAFELLDAESPTYALDIVSVVEATLDDPRPVLSAQQFQARGEAVAAMKAEGIEYDERMELLEEVTHPKPLDELLDAAFETYARQPAVGRATSSCSPKSVVRDLYERAMTFGEFIAFYKLARSEGLVLRYLSDAYRALGRPSRSTLRTEDLRDLIEWLGELVRQVDSSLLDEWEELVHPDAARHAAETPSSRRPRRATSPRTVARSSCWCATSCSAACSSPPSTGCRSSARSRRRPRRSPAALPSVHRARSGTRRWRRTTRSTTRSSPTRPHGRPR